MTIGTNFLNCFAVRAVAHKGKTQLNIDLGYTTIFRDTKQFYTVHNNISWCKTIFHGAQQFLVIQNNSTRCTTIFRDTRCGETWADQRERPLSRWSVQAAVSDERWLYSQAKSLLPFQPLLLCLMHSASGDPTTSVPLTDVLTPKSNARRAGLTLGHIPHWTELKAWFPYRCICRICRACRTKKIHRTDRIHSISYSKLYLSFLLYWAFVREVSIKLYLSYEFFSYDRRDGYDRYNDMETRLNASQLPGDCPGEWAVLELPDT